MSFLKAEWRKLALANYEVDPSILAEYLPWGTELDLWQGRCYVSLVGFMFQNTKLLGVKVPYHTDFEEVNLRFYVKRLHEGEWRRGVVFIKEIVPRRALTFVANTVYKEHYETMKMTHSWKENADSRTLEYAWARKDDWQHFKVKAGLHPEEIPVGSETEFITEHYWGYAKVGEGKTNEYQVTHPRWKCYPILDHTINVDLGAVYGSSFACLNDQQPKSVMLAAGSEITVERKNTLLR